MDGREIKFRAKPEGSNEWIYGGGVITLPNGKCVMLHLDNEQRVAVTMVDLETVGQFTGPQDKNGTNIFEGDIVISSPRHYLDRPTVVEWSGEATWDSDGAFAMWSGYWHSYAMPSKCEVVGNRTDNPELLEAA